MNKLKRALLKLYFHSKALLSKNYLQANLKKRKGKCKKCGQCCSKCLFLDKKTNLCKIYNHRIFIFCHKHFPLSKSEQDLWNVKNCGYKFNS